MSRAVRFFLVAAFIVAAPVLFLQGQANAGKPGPSFGWNGYNLATLAMGGLRVEQSGSSVSMVVDDRGLALARRAFAAEPLASDALFIMAINERAAGDQARMQGILDGANALDKRNRNIGALQLEQTVLAGELQDTFSIVDRLATVHPRLTDDFVQPLVGALAQEDAVPVLAAALQEGPIWAEAFWKAVPAEPQLVSRMFDLRQLADAGTTPESDAALLAGLVAQGRFGESFAFWDQVAGASDNQFGFVDSVQFAPFGWELETSGERAMSARGEGRYEVYIQTETSGSLGRQLLRLPAGSYSFTADIAPRGDAAAIRASLICADSNEAIGNAQPLDEAASWTVSGSCSAYWLELDGGAWDRRDAMRATISDMRFQAEG